MALQRSTRRTPRRSLAGRSPRLFFFLLGAAIAGAVVYAARPSSVGTAGAGLAWGWLRALLAGVNATTFLLYAYDKLAAGRAGRARVPEGVLHLFELLGGTPAALIGQLWLRHKSSKPSYQTVFYGIVILQVLVAVTVIVLLSGAV
jgi:uncharacterized membrane protein YsdA (DUF1294 family)